MTCFLQIPRGRLRVARQGGGVGCCFRLELAVGVLHSSLSPGDIRVTLVVTPLSSCSSSCRGGVRAVCWSPDGNLLLVALRTQLFALYETRSWSWHRHRTSGSLVAACFSPNSRYLLVASNSDGEGKVWSCMISGKDGNNISKFQQASRPQRTFASLTLACRAKCSTRNKEWFPDLFYPCLGIEVEKGWRLP